VNKPKVPRASPLPGGVRGGFTIAELLVAAVIVLIAVFGVVGVTRYGAGARQADYRRSSARAIIMNVFERSFGFGKFPGPYVIPPPDGDSGGAAANMNNAADTAFTLPPVTVTIERRAGGSPLSGEMSVAVERKVINVEGADITVDSVRVCVRWDDGVSNPDSVVLTKILADTR